jgi:hypothetical protein
MTSPLWAAALTFADAVRTRYTNGSTGTRWLWPVRGCPAWCARDHRCTARHGYPSGEHRSMPDTRQTGYGSIIVTGVQTIGGARRLELRLTVAVPAESTTDHVRMVPTAVDLAVRAVLATPTRQPPPARAAGRKELAQ